MNSLSTRCPHCQTAFQVSPAQLEVADGNVRCGACLNVFLAREHFLDEHLKPDTAHTTAEPVNSDTESETASLASAPESDAGFSEPGWELLEEIHSEELAPDAPDEELLTEPVNSQKQMFFEDDGGRTEPLLFGNRSSAFIADLDDDEDAPDQFTPANRAALQRFSVPVEMHSSQKLQVNLFKLAGAALLTMLLISTLALQWIWFNRDALSRQTDWRPRIEWMCAQLSCTVAPLRDLAAISSENLVVRSHPETANALLVSLTFHNNAAFAQPFPTLILKFTDADQKPVATRSFLPQEYLQEELRDITLMPPDTSVQARVDIVDPGTDAINYEVFLGNVN